MRILETDRDPAAEIRAALTPPEMGPNTQIEQTVRDIIADVKTRGDQALLELGRKFDSPELRELRVSESEFEEAYRTIKPKLLEAIRAAKANIERFHARQMQTSWFEMHDEFTYGQVVRPIEKVGFYAPGGLAPYPSTVLMTAVPGIVAGVSQLVMCAPVQRDGKIHGPMLVAASECGVKDVFKVGGAQAVAAMAFGSATVPQVDKIVGPGNAYVTEAKRQVYGMVGIDQLAGPSEILVLADESANPSYVAADMLSQAEHAHDSRCAMITNSRALADAVLKELRRQTDAAARKDCIRESLEQFGVIVICTDVDQCVELANIYAPEHLEIAMKNPWDILKKIKNAGTIMLGHYTPVPLCDYAAGPNHTLPTSGTARFSSALSVDDFIKKSGLLSYTREGLKRIAPTVTEIADCEGFEAHGNTVRIRIAE